MKSGYRFIHVIGAIAGTVIAGCQAGYEASEGPDLGSIRFDHPPNILWISCEDISPYLPMYGDSTIRTPNLERLAAEGIVFENCFATTGQCAPSRHSIITGIHSTATSGSNMRTGGKQFPDTILCFPLYLDASGYHTTNNSKTDYNFSEPEHASLWDESSRTAHWKKRPEGVSFFAVFNQGVTHESQIIKETHLRVDKASVPIPPYYPDTDNVRWDIARNYSNIIELDSIVGDFLDELEAAGLTDSTVVVFWSDHGGPIPRGKREVHESGTRVPMIIRLPEKQFAGTRVKDMVSLIDLGPTMLSLAGIEPPSYMHGKAFMGKFKAASQPFVYGGYDRRGGTLDMVRYVCNNSFLYIHNYYPELPWYGYYSYRNDKSRMMEDILEMRDAGMLNAIQMQWFVMDRPVEELYSMKDDPHSINNLAADPEYASRLKQLRREHHQWMLETMDLGVFPEAIQASMEREYGKTMYEIMRSEPVPLEKILHINQLWTEGEEAVPELIKALSDTLAVNRYHAAIGLGNLFAGTDGVKSALRPLLNDPEPVVQLAAAYGLYTAGEKETGMARLKEGIRNGLADNESGMVALSLVIRLDNEATAFRSVVEKTLEKQEGINTWNYYSALESTEDFIRTVTPSYLALGDSYTIGESVAVNERYPVQLRDSLAKTGVGLKEPVIVATTGWTTGELITALKENDPGTGYDLVSLLIGVNNQYRGLDTTEYHEEFGFLLEEAIRYAGGRKERVIVLSIPDWGVTPFAEGRDREMIAREINMFNDINRSVTEAMGVRYVDVTPVSRRADAEPRLVAEDGLHPSGSMYALWVERMMPGVLEILGKTKPR